MVISFKENVGTGDTYITIENRYRITIYRTAISSL